MNIDNAYSSDYLKATELQGDVTFTIKRVEVATLGKGKEEEQKPVVYFAETEKGFVLNKVNKNTIKAMYGSETDGWTGKELTLYCADVEFAGEMKTGIRVRPRRAQQQAPAQHQPGNGADHLKGQYETDAEKRKAWEGFSANVKAEFPNITPDDMAKTWRSSLMRYFPGKKLPEGVTAAEWRQFVADGFAPKVKESPISPEPVFTADSIPF
jgi:hypothetical protein